MENNEYQEWSKSTAWYPESLIDLGGPDGSGLRSTFPFYLCLGLAGEVGEVVEVFKKFARREATELNQEEIEKVKLELGDMLWYWTQICSELGLTISEVMEANKTKLTERYGK